MTRFVILGELETLIMNALWESKKGLSGKDIHTKVHKQHPVALTTVLTVLDRLQKKGVALKLKDEGRTFSYAPSLSKEAFYRELSRKAFKDLLEKSKEGALSAFVDLLGALTHKEMSKFERLLSQTKEGNDTLKG
jgi:predicted transcriptional regulator